MATNEKEFFAEKDACAQIIAKLCGNMSSDADVEELEKIIGKYQEQPQLLDPSLETLLGALMNGVRSVLRQRSGGSTKERPAGAKATKEKEVAAKDSSAASVSPVKESATAYFNRFQICRSPKLDRLLKVVYVFCKVRGYKTVVKFLPHEVADLEPVVHLLHSQDRSDYKTWQSRYALLIWLSILVRVPFDLSTIDSSVVDGKYEQADGRSSDTAVSSTVYHSLVAQLVFLGREYLSDSGATRDAAAVMLGQLLTRPDMSISSTKNKTTNHLSAFFKWASSVLQRVAKSEDSRDACNVFLTTGVFHALTEILKHGDRSLLLSQISVIFDSVLDVTDAISEGNVSTHQRKMTVKLSQRIGLTFLPPKLPLWRYERGERSLAQNLGVSDAENCNREEKTTKKDDDGDAIDANEEEENMPEEIEEVIDLLLNGLRDRDNVVRWSAAKGIGRLTGRLPTLALADEVVHFVMDLFSDGEGPGAWHGGCLAMAELARRGLLLPSRLSDIIPLIEKALQYDKMRGTHSVGAHVRDAGCYVCWAFARAYDPEIMRPHVQRLAIAMLVAAVCDREVNCRRAASAAFQENVGRQGTTNFPNGIEILTAADYFSLGNRRNAFTVVSAQVAKFPIYRRPIIDHFANVKLVHWDPTLRELSADALGVLTPLDPDYVCDSILPRLADLTLDAEVRVRHGATRGVAEIVVALSKIKKEIPAQLQTIIRNIVMKIEKKRLYRGRGGTIMRQAVCCLIRSIAEATLPLSRRAQERLLKSILENIRQARDETREEAVRALATFAAAYWTSTGSSEKCEDATTTIVPIVVEPLLKLLKHDVCSARSGGALGLGVLPSDLVACSSEMLERVVVGLIGATQIEENPELRSAAARRDAVRALAGLCDNVGIRDGTANGTELDSAQGHRIFSAILRCFEDYETTDQGDVGSIVRSAAIDAADVVATMLLHPKQQSHMSPAMATDLLRALSKQACEKIDSVRAKAGCALHAQLHRSHPAPLPVDRETRERMVSIFPASMASSVTWSSADQMLPRMRKLMDVPDFLTAVASGLCLSSANCNARTLVESARGALLGWASDRKKAKDTVTLKKLCDHLLKFMSAHHGDARVAVPVLETFEYLLASEEGVISALAPPCNLWKTLTDGIKAECRGSTNIKKIMAAAKVLVALLAFSSPARQEALRGIFAYMCHRYPKVRQTTAEAFFICVCNNEDIIDDDEKFDEILAILSATTWDGQIAHVKERRNELYELVLGVPATIKRRARESEEKSSDEATKQPDAPKREQSSFQYESLVREMHY